MVQPAGWSPGERRKKKLPTKDPEKSEIEKEYVSHSTFQTPHRRPANYVPTLQPFQDPSPQRQAPHGHRFRSNRTNYTPTRRSFPGALEFFRRGAVTSGHKPTPAFPMVQREYSPTSFASNARIGNIEDPIACGWMAFRAKKHGEEVLELLREQVG